MLRPYYPASSLFRVTDDDLTIQADFLGVIHGLRSFEGVKKRATTVEVGGAHLRVASLGGHPEEQEGRQSTKGAALDAKRKKTKAR